MDDQSQDSSPLLGRNKLFRTRQTTSQYLEPLKVPEPIRTDIAIGEYSPQRRDGSTLLNQLLCVN